MKTVVTLKDGSQVVIRRLRRDDADRSFQFFRDLPLEDRAYLRRDVTDRDKVLLRIREQRSGRIVRLAALTDSRIVADGSLELEPMGWESHIGEVRLIVSRSYQRKGLGTLLARELYFLAAGKKVEEVIVRFMAPQAGARSIFEKLGFRPDATLHDYVKDQTGHRQDLVVMRCDLEGLWRRLESHIHDSDWQRMR